LVRVAERLNLRASERRLSFPEFDAIPVYASRDEIGRLLQNTDAIEELRRASDTPTFFTTTVRREQDLWSATLLIASTRPRPMLQRCASSTTVSRGRTRSSRLLSTGAIA
jgi:hypothetical protein